MIFQWTYLIAARFLLIFSWEENVVENWKCQALKIWKFNAEITSKNTWSYLIYSFHFLDFWFRRKLSSIWMWQKFIRTWPTYIYVPFWIQESTYISMSTPIQPKKKCRKQVVYKAMQTASSKEITINNKTFLMCKVN